MYKLKLFYNFYIFLLKVYGDFLKIMQNNKQFFIKNLHIVVNSKYIEKRVSGILLKNKCIEFNFKTNFRLTSGKLSPVYCDCRKLISFTSDRNTIMNFAVKKLNHIVF